MGDYEKLIEKQNELANLQLTFDEFVESSKELENELQQELGKAESKIEDLLKKKVAAEDKTNSLQQQLQDANRSLTAVQNELQRLKEIHAGTEAKKKSLESDNDIFQDRIRILEATEIELLAKVEKLEEELIFARNDIEDLRIEKAENDKRLKTELTELMMEQEEIVGSLETEIKDLTARLEESEQQVGELNDELELGGDEIIKMTTENGSLKDQLAALQQEITELRASTNQNSVSSADLEEALSRIISLEDELRETSTRLSDAQERETEHVTSLRDMELQLQEVCIELEKANDELINTSSALSDAKSSLVEKEEALQLLSNSSTTRCNELERALAELRATSDTNEMLMRDMQYQLNLLKKEQDQSMKDGDALTELRAELSELNKAVSSRDLLIRDKDILIKQLESELAANKKKVESLEVDVSNNVYELKKNGELFFEKVEELNAVEKENFRLNSALKDTASMLTASEEASRLQKEALETEIKELQKRIQALEQEIESAHNLATSTTNEELAAVTLKLADAERSLREHTESSSLELSSLKVRVVELKGQLESAANGSESMNEEINSLSEKLVNTRRELSELKQSSAETISRLYTNIKALESELESLKFESIAADKANTEEHDSQIKTLTSQIRELTEQLNAKDIEILNSQRGVVDKSQREDQLLSEIERLTLDLESTKNNLRDLEIDNGTLTVTIRDLKSSLQQAQASHNQGDDMHAEFPTDMSTPQRKPTRRQSRTAADPIPTVLLLDPVTPGDHHGHAKSSLIRGHSNVSVSSIPQGKYALPASAEESLAALQAQQQLNEKYLLEPVGSLDISAKLAISSNDMNVMKDEIESLIHHYNALKYANAVLLQKLQALKGNIQVCCRARPPLAVELQQGARVCVDTSGENELAWFDKRSNLWKSFAFDRVWPMDAMQADVFSDIEPLALSVVDGYNACILAFGQTGSGKTFTMNGYGDQYGVSYRTLHKIFELLHFRKAQAQVDSEKLKLTKSKKPRKSLQEESAAASLVDNESPVEGAKLAAKRRGSAPDVPDGFSSDDESAEANSQTDFTFSVSVAMLEIYNEMVRDLLNPVASNEVGHGLDIRQTPDGGIGVPGLTHESVADINDVMRVFAKGSSNRATITTNLNEHSSRSHSILLVEITTSMKGGAPVTGKLYLVDLAGSERVEKSGVTGAAMKEAQHINKSLSALGDVMEALDSKAKHVPYRNSKLTYLLQDSLGGNSRTMMIVTICPTEVSSDETLFALQFATRVRRINLGAAHKNVSAKNLEETVKALKNELKETKKKKMKIEESLAEHKKEQKRSTDKVAGQLESRLRTLDDMKKSADFQIQALQKTNNEITTKLSEERAQKASIANELESASKQLKRCQDQLKTLTREKEHALDVLREKERELSIISMSEALAEKTTSKNRRKSISLSGSKDGDAINTDGNRASTTSVDGLANADRDSVSPIQSRFLKSNSFDEARNDNDTSVSNTPPAKKSTGIPRVPTRRVSAVTTAAEAAALSSSGQSNNAPRYLQPTKSSAIHSQATHGTQDSDNVSVNSGATPKESMKPLRRSSVAVDGKPSGIPFARPTTRSRAALATVPSSEVADATSSTTSRSLDALKKHQERLKRKRELMAGNAN